jgi:hypothetical protein
MEQSPSWESNSHSTSQGIAHLLWYSKFHDRVHKVPSLVTILSQMNPVHTLPSYFLSFHLRLGLVSGLFPSGFRTRIPYEFLIPPTSDVIYKKSSYIVVP